jgi:hypothetical protein
MHGPDKARLCKPIIEPKQKGLFKLILDECGVPFRQPAPRLRLRFLVPERLRNVLSTVG